MCDIAHHGELAFCRVWCQHEVLQKRTTVDAQSGTTEDSHVVFHFTGCKGALAHQHRISACGRHIVGEHDPNTCEYVRNHIVRHRHHGIKEEVHAVRMSLIDEFRRVNRSPCCLI